MRGSECLTARGRKLIHWCALAKQLPLLAWGDVDLRDADREVPQPSFGSIVFGSSLRAVHLHACIGEGQP